MTNTVATPNAAYNAMLPDWELAAALKGGTRAMREAGTKYLRKRLLEEAEDYEARLCMATLYAAFTDTVSYMVGRVFADPLITDDIVPWIKEEVVDDVDRGGSDITNFAAQVLDAAMSDGVTYVLVDAPPMAEGATLADQKAAGARPYWTHIDARRVIGWATDSAGKLVQLRITYEDERYDPTTFATTCVKQVRVFQIDEGADKVRVRIFERKVATERGKPDEWVEQVGDERTIDVPEIPLVPFYTGRTGFMTARSPLIELAELNIKHWRLQSSNDDLVEVAQVPILTAIGIDKKDKIVIGSRTAINLPKGAELKYVEHTGKAIEAGRTAVKDLEQQMRDMGAQLLKPKDGPAKTATESGEDAERENSDLGRIVRDTEDSLNNVLRVTALFRSVDDGGSVKAQPNLDPAIMPVESMNVLIQMADKGYLSPPTLFEEGKRRGLLRAELEWEEEQTLIKEHEPEPLTLPVNGDPTQPPAPGQPAPQPNIPPQPAQ